VWKAVRTPGRAQDGKLDEVGPDCVLGGFATGGIRREGNFSPNELLGRAWAVHQVVMRETGPDERCYVSAAPTSDRRSTRQPSRDSRQCQATDLGISTFERTALDAGVADIWRASAWNWNVGWRAEINLKALDWIRAGGATTKTRVIILGD